MEILATAWSAKDTGGTNAHEPMIWVIERGKGRSVTNVMGHGVPAMKCVGFQTTLIRGCEWAATGKVTEKPVPAEFPTKEKSSSVK
jgi:type 1 glutamine amidotransferase